MLEKGHALEYFIEGGRSRTRGRGRTMEYFSKIADIDRKQFALATVGEAKVLMSYVQVNYARYKELWNKIGGFSEEFNPGIGSDPDFNMKLWKIGVRIFKGLNDFKVYHFGSVVLRKKINKIIKGNKYGSKGSKIFLLKWGISIKFFKKFYLLSDTEYKAPLREPNKKLLYYVKLFICKLNYIYLRIFYSKLKIKSNSQ